MRDYVLVIDRSGSMGEAVSQGNFQPRWDAVKESALAVARKCQQLDPDGIDVYMFNSKFQYFPNTTAEKVSQLFRDVAPMGGTDFVPVLSEVFQKHFQGERPTTVLVVTDGEPSNGAIGQRDLAKLLIQTSNRLEGDAELAISFIQIGDDQGAQVFLKKLDDDLKSAGAKYDIVDTKTFEDLESMSLDDVLLAAIQD